MKLRTAAVAGHRWLSLAAAAFWILQAATGIFAVFHWEIDDASVAGEFRALDLAALERRAVELAATAPGRRIDSIWTSAGATDRFDIFVAATPPDRDRVVRVDGAGNVLRTRLAGEVFANGGLVESLVRLHQSLLAGETGRTIVGLSGFLLLTNLVLGALAAWPRAGKWRRALLPAAGGARPARLYAWHRALGLWAMLPAACLVTAGILLAFEDGMEGLIRPAPVDPPALAMPGGESATVGMAEAARSALARFPGAALSGIGFPSSESAWWAVRLRQPGELRRAYGKTRVYVSAIDGAVGADFDALDAAAGRHFVDSLFAFHTGEMGGMPGRLAALAVGLWLFTMCLLGLRLWRARRRPRQEASRAGRRLDGGG